MPTRIPGRFAQSQTPVQVNWRNSLTQGLVFCALPIRNVFYELISNQFVRNTGATKFRNPVDGNRSPALFGVGGGATGGRFTEQTGLDRIAGPFSIFVEASMEVNASTQNILVSRETINGNGVGFLLDDIAATTDGIVYYANNSTRTSVSGLGANSEQFAHRAALTVDGTNSRFYAKRNLVAALPTTVLPTADSTRRTTVIGIDNTQNLGSASLLLAWNRIISLAEYRALFDNPWQILLPVRRIWGASPVAASPAPTFSPTARITRRREWDRQPNRTARLNNRNKFARGAMSLISGLHEYDLVTGLPLNRNGTGQGIEPSKRGNFVGIRTTENGTVSSKTPCNTGMADYVAFWYGIAFSGSFTPAGNSYLCGNFDDVSGLGIAKRHTEFSGTWTVNAVGSANFDSGEVFPENVPTLVVFTLNSDGIASLYRDGVLKATGDPPRTIADDSLKGWALGSIRDDTSDPWGQDCLTFLSGKLKARWTEADVKEFSRNPWQILSHMETRITATKLIPPNTADGSASGTSTVQAVRGVTASAAGVSTVSGSIAAAGTAAGAATVNAVRGWQGTIAGTSSVSAQPAGAMSEGSADGVATVQGVTGFVAKIAAGCDVIAVPADMSLAPDIERIIDFPLDDELDFILENHESLS